MIDFAKLYCDLHPHQIITNFCLKDTCMVGLCATCICTHTEYHVAHKTTPQYQNIRATFSTMHDLIRKKITCLDTQKNRIEKIVQFVHTKRKALKQNVQLTRKQAIAAVNTFFDNKEKSMLREVESEQKKMGLHSEARMESLMNSLNRETSLLITSAQELNSQNFLESYQRIKTQTLFNASKLEEEIARQLDRNQDFETIINSNDEFTHAIYKALEQSLQLSFKMNYRPLNAKPQQPTGLRNDSAILCQDKVTSRFGNNISIENCSQPLVAPRLSSMESNVYSAMSFSHVPQMSKKETAKFNPAEESQKQTTKSIPLEQTEKSGVQQSVRQSRSLVKEMYQSDIIRDSSQSNVFRERDINQRQPQQSLSKSVVNRNHQSQIILVNKPLGYQSATGWNQPPARVHQPVNQSTIENFNQFSMNDKVNFGGQSQMGIRNQSAVNLNQYQRNGSVQKFNFVPQIFEANQFNRQQTEGNLLSSECKKVRKSGLTLLKSNQNVSTSRTKLQAQ